MSENIIIRTATNEDVHALYMLMRQYIVDFYHQPEPKESDLKSLIQHLLDNPSSGLQFVAEENEKIIGFATLYFTFSTLKVKRQAILNDLFVVPQERGKKVGEKLFETCLNYIRKNDFSSMTWETAKDNLVAQSLYTKMGGKQSEWLCYEIN
ncbi:GNAT family N-acetyltransferase [Bacillus sp. FJAT-49732]|uniref:GNAT family N-acetyltransferase n=1 Tax=Lederbergia citrisecunda TaxID=2833583 RepID=A0A942YQP9_9BACI|nr:GNAT family N-acetyltransferase [Lederbergia citrisecunda]MBS4202476.1 GNAT family N-acetyltransferase [Lederbergia citrisecunda]